MNNVIAYIYALIILESRMSIDNASKVLNVEKKVLTNGILEQNFSCEKARALEFCEYENQVGLINVKKSIFIGKLLYAKLNRILISDNKKEKLYKFIKELEGKEKIDALFEKHFFSWSLEDQELFLKYKIKYALDNHSLSKKFPITRQTISRWVNKYPEGQMREELMTLNGYVASLYADYKKGEGYAK